MLQNVSWQDPDCGTSIMPTVNIFSTVLRVKYSVLKFEISEF